MMNIFAVTGLALVGAASAHAQATRTWVSGVGDDANPCSRTAPGKTFAGAISKTAAGGEIDALDPGGFGTLTVTKSITIDGGGGQVASVLASGTIGFNINAGSNDVVTLRNLSINGAGTTLGTIGIHFIAGKQLIIDHCKITGFSGNAVEVLTGSSGRVLIKDSIITNCGGGVFSNSSDPTTCVTLENVTIQGTATAVDTISGLTQLTGCTITQNSAFGLHAEGGVISIAKSLISNNAVAAQAENAATVRLSDNDLFDNGVCFAFNGTGKISSATNNRKAGNASSATPNGVISVQ